MHVRTIPRARCGAPLLALTMSMIACGGELDDDEPFEAGVLRGYDDPEIEIEVVGPGGEAELEIKAIESPLISGQPGSTLCPDCAKLVGWTSSRLDVAVRIDANHGFEALSIGLVQDDILPIRIKLASDQGIGALYHLRSQVEIRPVPELVVIAYDFDGKATAVQIDVTPQEDDDGALPEE